MIKFKETFSDVIPDGARTAIDNVCNVIRDRKPDQMETAYNNLQTLADVWKGFKSEHDKADDVDFAETKHDEMVDCTTPFCIRTKK